MCKKTFCIILSLLLCLTCCIPAFASVTYMNAENDIGLVQYIDDPDVTGTVYISISDDGRYVVSDGEISGEIMAYVPVALADLQFDLCDYDLDSYVCDLADFDPEAYGRQPITVMHLYIYTLEHYYSGGWDVNVTGGPGSSYLQNGFWGHDENLTYYVNGAYPLEGEGWGATSDRICLTDGDFVDVQMYTSWYFWGDSAAGYHYFLDENDEITHEYTVNAGEAFVPAIGRAWGSLDIGGATEITIEDDYTFFYGEELYADESGGDYTEAYLGDEIVFDEPGIYYLWADGNYGEDNPEDIVSSPAYARVEVLGGTTPVDPDTEAAAAVDALIDAIGEVTLASEDAIAAARDAYEELTEAQQALVTKLQTLIDAEEALEELQIAAHDAAEAAYVDELIDAIGEVTLESEDAIAAAREAYDELTEAQQALVTKLQTLIDAEEALEELQIAAHDAAEAAYVDELIDAIGEVTLESEDAIAAAREAYDELTEAQQALVTKLQTLIDAEEALEGLKIAAANAAAAADVDALIDEIGTVTLNSETAIAQARAAYNELTDAQKALVSKLDTLIAAESMLASLQAAAAEATANAAAAAEVDAKIDAIGTVTLNSEGAIAQARAAYNALTDAQKALVTKLGTLTAAESTLAQLQAAAQEEKPSDNDQQSGRSIWDKILDFFRTIINFFKNLFKR